MRRGLPDSIVGSISFTNNRPARPVYDGKGAAPDISTFRDMDERLIWVLANSVWMKERAVRQIDCSELLALWDYKGKLESAHWDHEVFAQIIQSRLDSPPAKILRAVAFSAFQAVLELQLEETGESSPSKLTRGPVGLTAFVPYSPLELKEETGEAAARSDDAPVDYSIWAEEGETPEVARARESLRKLAVLWWAICMERDGKRWLAKHPNHTEEDRRSIEECVWRARACT